MVERNMIREGFIRNTATSPTNPTFSGSQVVNESQQALLADGNFAVTAVTVSATEDINLTADLGARWKLNRLELYTDSPSASGITMEISDNNVEYHQVTMTGSPNLYVGDILDSTISGTPRYIRYRHFAASDLNVFEWRAMSDDTIVDFGDTGAQTEVEIPDAPIGKPSDIVTELKLFNRYPKAGSASVFIENTGVPADELIEVATSTTGPWFGRAVFESNQPTNTPFVSGTLDNTRVVTSSGYFADFVNEQNTRGWSQDNGALSSLISTGYSLDSNNSTQPRLSNFGLYRGITGPNIGGTQAAAGVGNYVVHQDDTIFRSDWYDRVRVRLIGPSIDPSDFVEGPRLYWRGRDSSNTSAWDLSESTLSQFPFNTFTGEPQDFIFEVGTNPTWSGTNVIRGLSIQPFTTTSGLNVDTIIQEVEVYHSSRSDRVVLDFAPTISGASGIRPHLADGQFETSDSSRVVIALTTRVLQPCIITKVIGTIIPNSTASLGGFFLARFDDTNPNFAFPSSDGTDENFIVKNVVRRRADDGSLNITEQLYVRWKAEPGDFIGWTTEGNSAGISYRGLGAAGFAAAYNNPDSSSVNLTSAQVCQDDLNALDSDWARLDNRLYHLWFESVSSGDYVAQGTYTTPIFDGATLPGLLSASFTSIEDSDSSIDSRISEAFKTIKVRASDNPPKSNADLGEATVGLIPFDSDNPPPWWLDVYRVKDPELRLSMPVFLNEEGPGKVHDFQLNFINAEVTGRSAPAQDGLQNVGATMMYHPDQDELWVMNVLLSGTYPNDLRPIWDVYSPDDFSYVRTQHVTGDLSYAFDSGDSLFPEVFEPAGFVFDEDNDEIYIFARQDDFFINTATYYAAVINSDGEFVRLSYRNGAVGGDSDFLTRTVSVTFDGTYFYHLTDDTFNNPSQGSYIAIYQRGSASDPTQITFIDSVSISSISGFESVGANPVGQQIVYNPQDGLIYIMYADRIDQGDNDTFRQHEMHAIKIDFNSTGTAISTATKIPLSGIEASPNTGGVFIQSLDVNRDGFLMDQSTDAGDLIRDRDLAHGTGWVYIPNRDMYAYLQTRGAGWGDEANPRTNLREGNTRIYDRKSLSFMLGFGANTASEFGTRPTFARPTDAIWGSASGTLQFETKQPDTVLFPPGRYGQVEYTLNASSDLAVSPQLITSQLDQGIRVGDIPASGTRSIYLRTNLPEDQVIGDQQTRLKVFWELPE